MPVTLAKKRVAERFGMATESYSQAASLQQAVGKNLISLVPGKSYQTCIDLGCGPGEHLPALQKISDNLFAVDISTSMLKALSQTNTNATGVCGDAEQLPFADNSVDIIYSSLTLQWCSDLLSVMEEAYRVLKPGGIFAFSCLLEGSLWQLKKAWRSVDDFEHINRFPTMAELDRAIESARLERKIRLSRPHTNWYPDIRAAFASLRGVGANTVLGNQRKGLMGRQTFQKLTGAFDQFGDQSGLPMTYQIYYGVAAK